MKLIFMGTPDFAVPSLSRLISDGHELLAVFTQTDKPKGRGHKLTPPPIKILAEQNNIPVFQPKSLKGDQIASEIRKLDPELIVVAAYGKVLPASILNIPRYGCMNVHASLLPKYRGAGPIQWSVIHGEAVTGVTTMFMAEGIDTGDILLQAETEISENETAGILHDRLSVLGAKLLSDTIKELQAGTLKRIPQKEEEASYAPMLTKELSVLNFQKPAKELHNLICGLSPWPVAETSFLLKRLKIYESEILPSYIFAEGISFSPGDLLSTRHMDILCGDGGVLRLCKVQYEGSRQMTGEEFLRGRKVSVGETFGEL